MKYKNFLLPTFLLFALFSFSCSSEDSSGNSETDELTGGLHVEDQTLQTNVVTVQTVTINKAGWLLLYRQDGMAESDLGGSISTPKFLQQGFSSDVKVQLLPNVEVENGEILVAVLHTDDGETRIFEFDGSNGLDSPIKTSAGEIVMAAFEVSVPGDSGGDGEVGSLVWQDEFNEGKLDLSKWNYETGTGVNGDFGTGQLDRATAREENVSFRDGVTGADGGCLVITTRKENYIDRNYTSGRINTAGNASWGPGHRIVARVMPKGVRYQGQGFAFWMMPAEKPANISSIMWPQGGEIDIMEYVGSIPYNNLGTVHYAWFWQNNEYRDWNHGHLGAYYNYETQQVPTPPEPGYGNYPPPANAANAGSSGFHTYGIDWYHDRMEFFVDDNVYHIHYFNDGAAFGKEGEDQFAVRELNGRRVGVSEYSNHFEEWQPFEHKMYAILSAGVGGSQYTYGGPIVPEAEFPVPVFIDWVRVYKLE